MFARRFGTLALVFVTLGLVACDETTAPTGVAAGSAQRFFLATADAVDNTAAPTVEVDREGGTHTVYPAYAGGRAYYAYCPRDCSPEQLKVVRFETEGTVANAMLALDPAGKPHVLLSSFAKVYYASCAGDCTTRDGWQQTELFDHNNEKEVSGEAFALDPSGRPRFLIHTYRAYLGIGQKPPIVHYVTCDEDCHNAANWTASVIANQMWYGTSLHFGADGRPRAATVATMDVDGTKVDTAAYVECTGDCTTEAGWTGIGLMPAYQSEYEAVSIKPTVSMALTKRGAPRIAVLGKTEAGKRAIGYFECDSGCTGDAWRGGLVSDHDKLGAGLDLALDQNDHPRFVYTLDYNIALAYCNDADCTRAESKWDLAKVEYGGELTPDAIFLYEGCNVGAWFLHSPSIALTFDGLPRVGYQARDISAGSKPQTDPTKPQCRAGTDMTWSRMAVMGPLG